MWTEAHRARHEAGLKEMVSTCGVEEIARWLERVDPLRSERATPVLPVCSGVCNSPQKCQTKIPQFHVTA